MTREQRLAASPPRLPASRRNALRRHYEHGLAVPNKPNWAIRRASDSSRPGPKSPFCTNEPNWPSSGADQVPCRWKAEDVGRGRPNLPRAAFKAVLQTESRSRRAKRSQSGRQETPCGVTTNTPVPRQTNPISGAAGRRPWRDRTKRSQSVRRGRGAEQPDFPLFFGFFRFFRLPPVRLRPDFGPSRASGSNEGSNNGSLRREFVRNEANWPSSRADQVFCRRKAEDVGRGRPTYQEPPEGGTPNGVQAQESPRQTKPIGRSGSGKGRLRVQTKPIRWRV